MTTNVQITKMPEKTNSGNVIVHVTISGALTEERYGFLQKSLNQLIDESGKISILLVLQELDGMTAAASLKDLKFEASHIADIDRVAVACSSDRDEILPESAIPFTEVNARFFSPEEMDQALEWLKSG